MKYITDTNYYVIHGWMRKMGLKGLQLDLYAIIYGFCQDNGSAFYGTISYLEEFTGFSRRAVIDALNDLVGKGYIRKDIEDLGQQVKRVKYSCNKEQICIGSAEFAQGGVQILQGGCADFAPNKENIYINNIKETTTVSSSKEKRFSLTPQMPNQSTECGTPSPINNQKTNPNGGETRCSAPTTTADREEREQAFREQADKFIPEYGRKMIDAFCDYWTEFGGKKMRFEKEKTWELKRRLQTWKRNDDERKARYQRTAAPTTPDNSLDAKDVLKNLGI